MPSKAYINPETPVTWLSSAGTELITLTSLAAAAGRQGALHDFGTIPRANRYKWRAWVKMSTTPVVGEVIKLFIKTSDGTHPDNDDGTGNIAVSAENKLKNLTPIGFIKIDEAAIGVEFSASGNVLIDDRYAGPVFWNSTADALSTTAADHGFSLTPIPYESQ